MGGGPREIDPPWGVAVGGRAGTVLGARTWIGLDSDICAGLTPVVFTFTPAIRRWIGPRYWVLAGAGVQLVRARVPEDPLFPMESPPRQNLKMGFAVALAGGMQVWWEEA